MTHDRVFSSSDPSKTITGAHVIRIKAGIWTTCKIHVVTTLSSFSKVSLPNRMMSYPDNCKQYCWRDQAERREFLSKSKLWYLNKNHISKGWLTSTFFISSLSLEKVCRMGQVLLRCLGIVGTSELIHPWFWQPFYVIPLHRAVSRIKYDLTYQRYLPDFQLKSCAREWPSSSF